MVRQAFVFFVAAPDLFRRWRFARPGHDGLLAGKRGRHGPRQESTPRRRRGSRTLISTGDLASLVERSIASRRRRHEKAVTFLQYPLDIFRVDMRMADRHLVLVACLHDARHLLENRFMLVLARHCLLLAEVALAD